MANPHLARTLATFRATVQRTKNRLVAIPADVQRQLGLERRPRNHILLFSMRPSGRGRWNHHLAYLTRDNEFAIPSDITHIRAGTQIDVKIHRVVPDADALEPRPRPKNAGDLLVALGDAAGDDGRTDGSLRVDELLYGPSDA